MFLLQWFLAICQSGNEQSSLNYTCAAGSVLKFSWAIYGSLIHTNPCGYVWDIYRNKNVNIYM